MCGRYVTAASPSLLTSFFSVDEVVASDDELAPSWNVAPTAPVPAIATSSSGRRLLGTFRWGLVPSWAADPSGAARMINARLETVATKPAFREALVRRRCVLPASGFYEWRLGPGGAKQPVFVADASGAPLAFAGLWEVWSGPGTSLRTCTIITTEAAPGLDEIHSRMPVALPPSAWSTWLDRSSDASATSADVVVPFLASAAVDAAASWVARDVSTLVNDVRNDGPELLDRNAVSVASSAASDVADVADQPRLAL